MIHLEGFLYIILTFLLGMMTGYFVHVVLVNL